ncbi:hypothetical protein N9L68_07120 [bacterium]|nr:hypothetical protein [bacterium]
MTTFQNLLAQSDTPEQLRSFFLGGDGKAFLANARMAGLQRAVDKGVRAELDAVTEELRKIDTEQKNSGKSDSDKTNVISIDHLVVSVSFAVKTLGRIQVRASSMVKRGSDKFKEENAASIASANEMLTSCGHRGIGTKKNAFWHLMTIPTVGPLCIVNLAMEGTSWSTLEAKRVSTLDLLGHRLLPQTIVPPRNAASMHCSRARP